jgi:deoxyribodipyrimidine photo-lyase
MGTAQQRAAGLRLGETYPQPVRDHEQAAREARAKLTAWKRAYVAREESQRVFEKHGSRKRQPARGRTKGQASVAPLPAEQGDLF